MSRQQTQQQETEDEDDDLATAEEECINIGSNVVKFQIENSRVKMRPKEIRKFHRTYVLPKKTHPDRDPVASVVSMLTNGMVLSVKDPKAKPIYDAVRAQESKRD